MQTVREKVKTAVYDVIFAEMIREQKEKALSDRLSFQPRTWSKAVRQHFLRHFYRVAVIIILIGGFHGTGYAADAPTFTEENIVRAILGEARGEGDVAMYAHACAIRNRKNLEGVFGATAEMEPIPADLWHRASRAWHTSEYTMDSVRGATHWLSDYDMRACSSWRLWIADYTAVARVGTTTFYRRK